MLARSRHNDGRALSVSDAGRRLTRCVADYDFPTNLIRRVLWCPECVNLVETGFVNKCYAAIGSGGLMKTVGSSAGGSGVPFTKRCGLRAYAA